MVEPRAPLESEMHSLLGFLDKNLRPSQNWSIAAEYPSVFARHNLGNLRIIADGESVLAHAAIRYLHVKNVMGVFKVAAIGSVLTDPNFRNQGHSQKILESCLSAAEKEGADFAILWTDLYDFYRKLDFELAGSEMSIVVDKIPPIAGATASPAQKILGQETSTTGLHFMHSSKISPEAILRLYSQHVCASVRTSEDIRKYLSIPNTNVFTAWGSDNQLRAYAVEGKGLDLKGYLHEWGGSVPDLTSLIGYVHQTLKTPLTLIAPANAQNLIRHLSDWGALVNEGFLGMIRPVSYQNLFFKINRFARQNGIKDLILEQTAEGFRIGTKDDFTIIPSVGELTRLLFGPIDKSKLKPKFQALFPIPIWMWGWDSV